jgi:hypothetical protein
MVGFLSDWLEQKSYAIMVGIPSHREERVCRRFFRISVTHFGNSSKIRGSL